MKEYDKPPSSINELVAFLHKVHQENVKFTAEGSLVPIQYKNMDLYFKILVVPYQAMVNELRELFIEILCVTNEDPDELRDPAEWRFLVLSFYLINKIQQLLVEEKMLSVSQTKDLKHCVNNIIQIGIYQNMDSRLPHFVTLRNHKVSVEYQYSMLKATCSALITFIKFPLLRYYLVSTILPPILVSLFQLGYQPLKRPFAISEDGQSISEDMYVELVNDHKTYRQKLESLEAIIYPPVFLKELMVLFRSDTPTWFKKAVSAFLTRCIKKDDGIENILKTMMDVVKDNDTTVTWKVVDILVQILLFNYKNSSTFQCCMTPQLQNLLPRALEAKQNGVVYERIYASFVKGIRESDLEKTLINYVLEPLKILTDKSVDLKNYSAREYEIFTNKFFQIIRVLTLLFIDTREVTIEISYLKPHIGILFYLYSACNSLKSPEITELKEILIKYLYCIENKDSFDLLDNLIFGMKVEDIENLRDDIIIEIKDGVIAFEQSDVKIRYPVKRNCEIMEKLCKFKPTLCLHLFGYALRCMTASEKYFGDANKSFMSLEKPTDVGASFEPKLAIYELLSNLSNHFEVINGIKNYPTDILTLFDRMFKKHIETGVSREDNFCSEAFQNLFTMTMVLDALIETTNVNLNNYDVLKAIRTIHDETKNSELKKLLAKILESPKGKPADVEIKAAPEENSQVDAAIKDVYDTSLPQKGHGLIVLEKLIASKDPEALERKQYILTVFQENLRHKDSYVYLSAINGLSTMAEYFTDWVLDVLCNEYQEYPKDEEQSNEVRMKVGEALVRTVKILGETTPKYKAQLLNTFLNGAKDEDPLMRASNFANLGELCKVLGYKLGTIVSEILNLVVSTINFDSSVEVRRAAVQVLRQLLSGLGKDMLTVLKDDISVLYRTLKVIYSTHSDDVMRLQAQLAIEEINHNMKDILALDVEMRSEEKIVVLK